MNDFWAKKLGGTPAAPQQPTAAPRQPSRAWWQDDPTPQPVAPQNSALAAQMPYSGQTAGAGQPEGEYIKQLLKIPGDQLTAEQMEIIAEWELQNKPKHNTSCPNCGSSNFLPKGTKSGNVTMPTDKCFECGGSSSTYVSSPEPSLGGSGGASAGRATRQTDTGGAGGSMYMRFRGTPTAYLPRGN